MDYAVWGSVTMVLLLVVFLGIVAWAWSAKRRAAFDEAARLPLEEEGERSAPARAAAHDKETGQ